MKYIVLTSCILFAVIQTALSIQCYQCAGKDCTTMTNCTSSTFDACSFTHTKFGDKFAKTCNKKSACDMAASACVKTKACAMKCCQTDLCNKDGPRVPPSAATTIYSKPFIAVTLVALAVSLF